VNSVNEWLAWEVSALGPCFAWAIFARSSKPQDAEQPWHVVAIGTEKSEKAARVIARMQAESVPGRLKGILDSLAFGTASGKRTLTDGASFPPSVTWWRGSEVRATKTIGTVKIGPVEVFWGKDMDAFDFYERATAALGIDAEDTKETGQ
jgi:hypothetical protein